MPQAGTRNPYYARLTDEYIYHHFKTVANNIKSPVILLQLPSIDGTGP